METILAKEGKVVLEQWWHPREIIFTREQVIWIIEWLPVLREGIWPVNPTGSGYTDVPINKKAIKARAYFETPCQVAGEIEARLKKTGLEGKLLVAEIQGGKRLEELEPESRRALNYISGWRRRRQTYRQWIAERQYRSQKTIKFIVKTSPT